MPQRKRPTIYPTPAFIEFLRKESKRMAEQEGCRSRVPFWRVLNHLKEELETRREGVTPKDPKASTLH